MAHYAAHNMTSCHSPPPTPTPSISGTPTPSISGTPTPTGSPIEEKTLKRSDSTDANAGAGCDSKIIPTLVLLQGHTGNLPANNVATKSNSNSNNNCSMGQAHEPTEHMKKVKKKKKKKKVKATLPSSMTATAPENTTATATADAGVVADADGAIITTTTTTTLTYVVTSDKTSHNHNYQDKKKKKKRKSKRDQVIKKGFLPSQSFKVAAAVVSEPAAAKALEIAADIFLLDETIEGQIQQPTQQAQPEPEHSIRQQQDTNAKTDNQVAARKITVATVASPDDFINKHIRSMSDLDLNQTYAEISHDDLVDHYSDPELPQSPRDFMLNSPRTDEKGRDFDSDVSDVLSEDLHPLPLTPTFLNAMIIEKGPMPKLPTFAEWKLEAAVQQVQQDYEVHSLSSDPPSLIGPAFPDKAEYDLSSVPIRRSSSSKSIENRKRATKERDNPSGPSNRLSKFIQSSTRSSPGKTSESYLQETDAPLLDPLVLCKQRTVNVSGQDHDRHELLVPGSPPTPTITATTTQKDVPSNNMAPSLRDASLTVSIKKDQNRRERAHSLQVFLSQTLPHSSSVKSTSSSKTSSSMRSKGKGHLSKVFIRARNRSHGSQGYRKKKSNDEVSIASSQELKTESLSRAQIQKQQQQLEYKLQQDREKAERAKEEQLAMRTMQEKINELVAENKSLKENQQTRYKSLRALEFALDQKQTDIETLQAAIDEMNVLQEKIQLRKRLAKKRLEAQQQMSSGAPLSSVSSYQQILDDEKKREEIVKSAESLARSENRLNHVLSDILEEVDEQKEKNKLLMTEINNYVNIYEKHLWEYRNLRQDLFGYSETLFALGRFRQRILEEYFKLPAEVNGNLKKKGSLKLTSNKKSLLRGGKTKTSEDKIPLDGLLSPQEMDIVGHRKKFEEEVHSMEVALKLAKSKNEEMMSTVFTKYRIYKDMMANTDQTSDTRISRMMSFQRIRPNVEATTMTAPSVLSPPPPAISGGSSSATVAITLSPLAPFFGSSSAEVDADTSKSPVAMSESSSAATLDTFSPPSSFSPPSNLHPEDLT